MHINDRLHYNTRFIYINTQATQITISAPQNRSDFPLCILECSTRTVQYTPIEFPALYVMNQQ